MITPEEEIIEIEGEVDEPLFHSQCSFASEISDKNLVETDSIKKGITRFRFKTGRTVLYVSMAAMGVAVAADVLSSKFLNVKSDLITSSFEAFKLITMTVLGYFFASNDSSSK